MPKIFFFIIAFNNQLVILFENNTQYIVYDTYNSKTIINNFNSI